MRKIPNINLTRTFRIFIATAFVALQFPLALLVSTAPVSASHGPNAPDVCPNLNEMNHTIPDGLVVVDDECVPQVAPQAVEAVAPEITAQLTCDEAGTYVITKTEGVIYQVGDAVVEGTVTVNEAGAITVIAVAEQGYELTGQTKFVLEFTAAVDCPEPGSITIVKDAQPDSNEAFHFNTDLVPSNFELVDNGVNADLRSRTFANLEAGTYTVTEPADAEGYVLADIDCNEAPQAEININNRNVVIKMEAGAKITCTFINTEVTQPTEKGSITIVKDAQPNTDQAFQFNSDLVEGNFTLMDEESRTFAELEAGVYAVTEPANTEGYELTAIDCGGVTEAIVNLNERNVVIAVDAGVHVTCTFVNEAEEVTPPETGTIKIVKDVKDGQHEQNFTFNVSGALEEQFILDDDTDVKLSNTKEYTDLAVGTYVFTEMTANGWKVAGIVCNDDAAASISGSTVTINLVAGAEAECTFVNMQEEDEDKIVVVKPVVTVTTPTQEGQGQGEGQVLGVSTQEKQQLAETGESNYLMGVFLGLSMIGAAGALSVATRKQYS